MYCVSVNKHLQSNMYLQINSLSVLFSYSQFFFKFSSLTHTMKYTIIKNVLISISLFFIIKKKTQLMILTVCHMVSVFSFYIHIRAYICKHDFTIFSSIPSPNFVDCRLDGWLLFFVYQCS